MKKLAGTDSAPRCAVLALALAALSALPVAGRAHAAGGAYVVEDSDIEEPGECKIESWGSFAKNGDRAFVASPGCVVDIFRPIEVGAQLARTRAAGVWNTDFDLKAKTNILSSEKNPVGIGLIAEASFDLTGHQFTAMTLLVPVTIPMGEMFKINLNGGWQYDRTTAQSIGLYGAGFEWIMTKDPMKVTLIGEVFGQTVGDPGAQAGLRFTPQEKFDIDVILGHNLTGEKSTWITVGLNFRFGGSDKDKKGKDKD